MLATAKSAPQVCTWNFQVTVLSAGNNGEAKDPVQDKCENLEGGQHAEGQQGLGPFGQGRTSVVIIMDRGTGSSAALLSFCLHGYVHVHERPLS
jgi:hypothetical protein